MESNVWQNELKEINNLRNLYEIESQKILKELDCLVDAQNDEVALLYTRRTLEVIVTELCEDKWQKERGNEPLLSIIDRLHRDKFLPDFAHASMQNLNKIATFGVHPKEFDPNQVRTAVLELLTVLKWYAKEKNYRRIDEKKKKAEEKPVEKREITSIKPEKSNIPEKKKSKGLLISIYAFAGIAVVLASIYIFSTDNNSKITEPSDSKVSKADTVKNKPDTVTKTSIKSEISAQKQLADKASQTTKISENKVAEKTSTKNYTVNYTPVTKSESIETLFGKISNDALSFADKKQIINKILAACNSNAVVSIFIDDKEVDKLAIKDYTAKLLMRKGYSILVNNKDFDDNGKIISLSISEEKKK